MMLLSGFRMGLSTVNDFCTICVGLIPSSAFGISTSLFSLRLACQRYTHPPSDWALLRIHLSRTPPTTSLPHSSFPLLYCSYSCCPWRMLVPRLMVRHPCFLRAKIEIRDNMARMTKTLLRRRLRRRRRGVRSGHTAGRNRIAEGRGATLSITQVKLTARRDASEGNGRHGPAIEESCERIRVSQLRLDVFKVDVAVTWWTVNASIEMGATLDFSGKWLYGINSGLSLLGVALAHGWLTG